MTVVTKFALLKGFPQQKRRLGLVRFVAAHTSHHPRVGHPRFLRIEMKLTRWSHIVRMFFYLTFIVAGHADRCNFISEKPRLGCGMWIMAVRTTVHLHRGMHQITFPYRLIAVTNHTDFGNILFRMNLTITIHRMADITHLRFKGTMDDFLEQTFCIRAMDVMAIKAIRARDIR